MPNGRLPTGIGAPVTWPEARSMRVTVPSAAFVTHSLPPATARSWGERPTAIFVTRPPSTRATARSLDSATHTAPFATTGLSGWRPTASGLPCGRPVAASKRCSVPAVAFATQHAAAGERDAVGPAVGPDRRGPPALAEGRAVAVAVGVGGGLLARHERRHGVDLRRRQRALEGRHRPAAVLDRRLDHRRARLEVVEVRPDAAVRPRRRERVAAAAVGGEDLLAVGSGPAAATAGRGRGLVRLRPDQRRPDEQREHREGGRQPGDRREDAVDAPQHVRETGTRSR